MELKNLPSQIKVDVKQNGSFSSLGFIDHPTSDRLVFLSDRSVIKSLEEQSGISAVITTCELASELKSSLGVAVCSSPRRAFYKLHNFLAGKTNFYPEDFPSRIDTSSNIHSGAHVADKNVVIGKNVVVEPGSVVFNHAYLEDDVIIRAGAIIGGEGFQFELNDGKILPIAHAGGVKLRKGVEIQSGTCVDRAVFGRYTEIGENTKIDNLVQVAHNVTIGKQCRIMALVTLSGSVELGDEVWVGPGAVISHGLNVGDRATVSLGAVVTKDVKSDTKVSGNFAVDHERYLAFVKSIR